MRFVVLSLTLLWLGVAVPARAEERLVIIMAKTATQKTLGNGQLARIYLRKTRFWNDGVPAIPVNLHAAHPLRLTFSHLVLGVLPEDQEAYWNEQYFHGIAPPFVLDSEEAVVQFVATTPGAIGYVSETAVTSSLRVLFYLPQTMSLGEKKTNP
jgi:ABC-type phosphate transport system substrate-binding protein